MDRTRKGFTLIELLVVISIIALLLSVLMPSLAKAKKQALRVICVSNLKQWGLAYDMYTNEYKGKFPTGTYPTHAACWTNVLPPYITAAVDETSDLYLCPAAKRSEEQGGRQPFAAWGGKSNLWGINRTYPYFSYGENGWVRSIPFSSSSPQWEKDSMWNNRYASQPYRIPILADASFPVSNDPRYSDQPPQFNGEHHYSVSTQANMKRFCMDRHEMSVNLLMMDWSVKRSGLKQLYSTRWHRTWEKTMTREIKWPEWLKNAKEY